MLAPSSRLALLALLALAVVVALRLAGCGPTGTPVSAADVTRAPLCLGTCRSPDGAWSVQYAGSIWIVHHGVRQYKANYVAGPAVTWATPHTLIWDDGNYELWRLDPVTRKRALIAGWSDFVVSPDRRWLAGWASAGGGSSAPAETVAVISPDGKTCLAVPHNSHESDEAAGFTRDGKSVVVSRFPYDPGNGASGPPSLLAFAISSLPASNEWC